MRDISVCFNSVKNRLPASGKILLALLHRLHYGSLTFTKPDGSTTVFKGPHDGPHADLRIMDWGVADRLIKSADIGMAECYRDGRLLTTDLVRLLEWCVVNQRALEAVFYGKPLVALLFRFRHWLRTNTRKQARQNIQAHYDLSNEFYQLWLDNTMTYSSALFTENPELSLEAAQCAKYERILRLLNPQPGETILEIGCGWGGFAEHAARTRSVKVTGITLSRAQLEFAKKRIDTAGLAHWVDLRLIDYRDVAGGYDYVVSIEMFEAVGERYWPVYFHTLYRCLKPGGRAMIQAITIDEAAFPRYRSSSDFIREYIFPGGMLAPLSRFVAQAEAVGLTAGEPFFFGPSYAHTLKLWRNRVNQAAAAIYRLGFDEKFLQIWRFYLCYCEAGFRSGRTNVVQIELARSHA